MVISIKVHESFPPFIAEKKGRKDTSNEFQHIFFMKIWMLISILIIGLLVTWLNLMAGTIILVGLMAIILLTGREKSTEMPDTLTIEKLKRQRELEERKTFDAKKREF